MVYREKIRSDSVSRDNQYNICKLCLKSVRNWVKHIFPLGCWSSPPPPIDYSDVIHQHATGSTRRHLDSIYHSGFRFIPGGNYKPHNCFLYDKVGWPSDIEGQPTFLFIYEVAVGKLSSYLLSHPGCCGTLAHDNTLLRLSYPDPELMFCSRVCLCCEGINFSEYSAMSVKKFYIYTSL